MKKFMTKKIDEDKSGLDISIDENYSKTLQADDEIFEYQLVGVVNHMGSADAGHYVSYINISRNKKFLHTESLQK